MKQYDTRLRLPMRNDAPPSEIQWIPFGIALLISLALTINPAIATYADGRADHLTALFLFCAMSAGFVHGIGFIPRAVYLRVLFSTPVIFILLIGAGIRLAASGTFSFLN